MRERVPAASLAGAHRPQVYPTRMQNANHTNRITVSLDAMGGDFAPKTTVEGAVLAAQELNIATILVGNEPMLTEELSSYDHAGLPIAIRHASEIITMDESPLNLIRKKRHSSIRVAFDLVKSGEAQAVVTAGNSGAALTASLFVLDNMKGIDRPAIATAMPTLTGSVIVIDAGANTICKPFNLVQFALMGSVYAQCLLGTENPRVGVLSNGEEDSKGTKLTRESSALLKDSTLNYIGYVEGKEVFKGDVDVVVCDGFVGNVLLKVSEGVAETIVAALKNEIQKSIASQLGYILAKKSFDDFRKWFDYANYGGSPLLGVNGGVIISHGRSNAKAIKNAIRVASELVEQKVLEHLADHLKASHDLHTVGKKHGIFDKVFGKDDH
jgi:phosphate acyltransferase